MSDDADGSSTCSFVVDDSEPVEVIDDVAASLNSCSAGANTMWLGVLLTEVVAGIGGTGALAEASQWAGSFGLSIRPRVKLDRAVAKFVGAELPDGGQYSANQIRSVAVVIDCLIRQGTVEERCVDKSPFISAAPVGPSAIFVSDDVGEFFEIAKHLHDSAAV